MKIRTGFVSNSSSSSFIIADPLNTTAEVAYTMLNLIIEEYTEWYNDRPEDIKFIDRIKQASQYVYDHIEYDEPIMFPYSCNYETYIWKYNGRICVDTCNNHPWQYEMNVNYVDEDWQWEDEDGLVPSINTTPMGRDWCDIEYFNLDTMKKEIRDDYSAQRTREKRKE